MIHLDTNYLIGLLVRGSTEARSVEGWLAAGSSLAASSIACTEFLSGPVRPEEVRLLETVLEGRLVPFDHSRAFLAAELFNRAGRRRGSRFDCMIAATAMLNDAQLATANIADFERFVPFGLKLAASLPNAPLPDAVPE
jgi:predicted nucleic acid-binding protein